MQNVLSAHTDCSMTQHFRGGLIGQNQRRWTICAGSLCGHQWIQACLSIFGEPEGTISSADLVNAGRVPRKWSSDYQSQLTYTTPSKYVAHIRILWVILFAMVAGFCPESCVVLS
jgi:hypothetical protein